MNVKKGIFRAIVVLSILIGLLTSVSWIVVTYNNERGGLILQKNVLINAKGKELELNYLTQRLKSLVEIRKREESPIKSMEEIFIEKRIEEFQRGFIPPRSDILPDYNDIGSRDYLLDEERREQEMKEMRKMVKKYIPYNVRYSRELDELQAKEINFWYVIKHKPLLVLLPIPYFLAGFLPLWLAYFGIYYVARYIVRGFIDKDSQKQ